MKSTWKKRVSSLLLALVLVLSLVPAAQAAGPDKVFTVAPGEKVSIDVSFFEDSYENKHTDSFKHIRMTDVRGLDSAGTLWAYDYGDNKDKVRVRESAAKGAYFYRRYPDMGKGDYMLTSAEFEADRTASGKTVVIEYSLYGEKEGYHKGDDGYIEIRVTGSSTSSSDLSYKVSPQGTVNFDRLDFQKAFEKSYRFGNMDYVEFSNFGGLDKSGHFTARDKQDSWVNNITESKLNGLWFHYNQADISHNGDCQLDTLTFVSDRNTDETLTMDFKIVGKNSQETVKGKLEIIVGKGSSSGSGETKGKGDVNYAADPGKSVSLDRKAFNDYYYAAPGTGSQMSYLKFKSYGDLDDYGYFTAQDRNGNTKKLDEKALDSNVWFYYDYRDIPANQSGDCDLDTLKFESYSNAKGTLRLGFELVGPSGNSGDYAIGTLEIQVGEDGKPNVPSGAEDIKWTLNSQNFAVFDSLDLQIYYKKYASGDLRYVQFTSCSELLRSKGSVYRDYGLRTERVYSASTLPLEKFYISDYREGDHAFDNLSFVAEQGFSGKLRLGFRAYGSGSNYVDGYITIEGSAAGQGTSGGVADIRYTGTSSAPIQINPNDIARFYAKALPGGSLEYVKIMGIPMTGYVYYNYYGVSPYGTPMQEMITLQNAQIWNYYYSPRSTADRSLAELTYVPQGVNYCTNIPFVAYGTMGAVNGNIHMSSTLKKVPEVYGATTKGGTVPFPAAPVFAAVNQATGAALTGVRFLRLPLPTEGRLELVSGSVNMPANQNTLYTYAGGAWPMAELRFTAAPGFVGNVELPYEACDAQGNAIAAGQVSIGVLNGSESIKKFKDMNPSVWCYKYVTELSDAGVIDGYADKSFKEKNPLTYGAALKLIMLGAGYPEQPATVKNSPFSGYLAKAKADGLVSGNVDLKKPITRLQVSQIAAKALKLNVQNLSSQKPFTDTQDVYVQALNAAGIVEGYFEGGKSSFKPGNTLTRGHISAIVWRMQQYRK